MEEMQWERTRRRMARVQVLEDAVQAAGRRTRAWKATSVFKKEPLRRR